MKKISDKMQQALNLMANGWRLEYRIHARKNWYQLFRNEGEKPITVHANTVSGMIKMELVSEGPSGNVQRIYLTPRGREYANTKWQNATS